MLSAYLNEGIKLEAFILILTTSFSDMQCYPRYVDSEAVVQRCKELDRFCLHCKSWNWLCKLRDSLLDQVRIKIAYCLNLLCPHPSYIWTMDIQETAFVKTAKKINIINNLKLMFVEYEKSFMSANTILPFRDPLIRIWQWHHMSWIQSEIPCMYPTHVSPSDLHFDTFYLWIHNCFYW